MALHWLIVLGLASQSGQSSSGSALTAAAAASGRPRECATASRRTSLRGPSVWAVARVPNLQRYCDLVSKAQAQLATSPEAARTAAMQANQALPGHAAPEVILARAALAMGSTTDAAAAFARARAIDPRSIEDPSTMYDLARVLRKTAKPEEALVVYRALVPRIDLLPTPDRRVAVLLEAAHIAMAAGETSGAAGSKSALEEAIAYLREARQRPPSALSGDVLLSLVLLLDRAGERAQADAAQDDAEQAAARLREGSLDYLASPADRLAIEAIALERSDRAAATKRWEQFLAGDGGRGPWAAASRSRLDSLRKSKAAPRDKTTKASKPAARKRAP